MIRQVVEPSGTPPEENNSEGTLTESTRDSIMEWHIKLGHLNVKDLLEASKNDKIRGLNIQSSEKYIKCDICLEGKMTRLPFPKKSRRVSEPCDIIHSEVCGSMRVKSNGNARYFVTFIDDV